MKALVVLQCRGVELRPFDLEQDLDRMFAWRNDLTSLALWSPRRYPVTRREFESEFESTERSHTHIRMMVVHKGKTVGTVYSSGFNSLNGWTYIDLFLAPDARMSGVGPIAWSLFANYLFTSLPIRLLYAEVYGFNSLSRKTLEKAGLELRATFPKHCYWDGEYHDKYVFVLTREQLEAVRDFLAKRNDSRLKTS